MRFVEKLIMHRKTTTTKKDIYPEKENYKIEVNILSLKPEKMLERG